MPGPIQIFVRLRDADSIEVEYVRVRGQQTSSELADPWERSEDFDFTALVTKNRSATVRLRPVGDVPSAEELAGIIRDIINPPDDWKTQVENEVGEVLGIY